MGGYWINKRLPQYVEIGRNPETECEINNSYDISIGTNIQLNEKIKLPHFA